MDDDDEDLVQEMSTGTVMACSDAVSEMIESERGEKLPHPLWLWCVQSDQVDLYDRCILRSLSDYQTDQQHEHLSALWAWRIA